MAYDFPGNVRELENIIERAYALGAQALINVKDLPALRQSQTAYSTANPLTLDDLERDLIRSTLATHSQNKAKAAATLGLSQRTLYRRLKKLGLN